MTTISLPEGYRAIPAVTLVRLEKELDFLRAAVDPERLAEYRAEQERRGEPVIRDLGILAVVGSITNLDILDEPEG
jgi:hypothetical protein